MATNEKVDVVVVGAGASGSVYAAVMAKQGERVVVLGHGSATSPPELRQCHIASSN